jgi:Domain of unknown function (DUF4389)
MSDTGGNDAEQQGGAPRVASTIASGAGRTAMASQPGYPVTAGLDAPLEVARWRVIGNYILAIPHLVVLYVLQLAANVLVFVAWFVVLFTGRMPPGMGNFIGGVHRYQWRVVTYALFLREQYPPFSVPSGYADPGGDPAWLQISPPEQYNRLAVLLRLIFIIPQAVFGFVLGIAFLFAWIVAFFAVLITGRWPEGLRKFVLGFEFWGVRVNAWYALLADTYPPFSIS